MCETRRSSGTSITCVSRNRTAADIIRTPKMIAYEAMR
jgi:hypothetical protein